MRKGLTKTNGVTYIIAHQSDYFLFNWSDMVRFKNRWLLVEFIPITNNGSATYAPSESLDEKKVWNAIKESVIVNFGDSGWGAVGMSLTVKYYSPTTNLCIIRVAREHHSIAWAAVTLIRKLQGKAYIPHGVSCSSKGSGEVTSYVPEQIRRIPGNKHKGDRELARLVKDASEFLFSPAFDSPYQSIDVVLSVPSMKTDTDTIFPFRYRRPCYWTRVKPKFP
ncbi:RNase P [Pyrrhoderma noxium]|uniref:RNase P n=1 Tax=Pyrrhoderma noxium TaxID=2282107 RepID=A0A286UAA7_9AGAM|nr:RNase P [Pyrrhoderma noxium]